MPDLVMGEAMKMSVIKEALPLEILAFQLKCILIMGEWSVGLGDGRSW